MLTLIALVGLVVRPADAQAVMGIGEQALGPPRGVFRVTLAPSFETFDTRFLPDGETERLGARLTTDALGALHFPSLGPAEAAVRALVPGGSFDASIGSSSLLASTSVNTLRVGAELGLTHRLSLMASLPIVRTRSEVRLEVNGTQGGTVGVNPASLDPDLAQSNQITLDEQDFALRTLADLVTHCTSAGASDARCPTVQANLAALQSLVTDATAAAMASAALYGPNAPFAPFTQSATELAIAARLDAVAVAFDSWSSLNLPLFPGAVFAGADVPVGSRDAQRLATDPAFGIGIDSLVTRSKYGLGDVELGLRLLLIDTPGRERRLSPGGVGLRVALVAGARIGTGEPPDANRPFDPGTGDGQHDLIGGAHVDLLLGNRLWATVTGRYVQQLEDQLPMRVWPRTAALAPLGSLFEVERKLGDVIEFEVAPRFTFGRYLSVGARYAYRDKQEDTHHYASEVVLPPDAAFQSASVLDTGTAFTEQELGVGFTYSTVSAAAGGLTRLPLEISYQHVESLSAEGGYVPKRSRDEIRLRIYLRLFGGS
ncbi:MAG TPA: hypothetical protein VMM77_12410 [Gemmatimonadaceae bacterium]|nr:hypothetical protein [Gemmatimonadaceae bacterium]